MLQVIIIIGAIFLRLVPHIPNFTPVSALAIFGGTYLDKKFAIAMPLMVMAVSDYLLLYINPNGINLSTIHPIAAMFHTTTIYVWGSIGISSLIGLWLSNHNKPTYIVGASIVSSLQFYLITNFGVWAGGMYSRDVYGLIESYIMGIPFFRWTLLGDLFYTLMFFGTFVLATRVANFDKYHGTGSLPASRQAVSSHRIWRDRA
jgi:hypothetical protein